MDTHQTDPILSVDDARSEILNSFVPVPATMVRINQSLHRVLAEEIYAPCDLPRFDNSSVDGFALRMKNEQTVRTVPHCFQVVGDIPAGVPEKIHLKSGQAARIMTGAALPAGADRIVPVEDTDFPYRNPSMPLPEVVTIHLIPEKGSNIRRRGQDIRKGQAVFQPNRQLSPADIGLLAMMGKLHILVRRQIRVAIFSTGDELVQPGKRISRNQIYDANSYMLQALVENAGCHPVFLGIAIDQPEDVKALFERAVEDGADLILTSAGVSVGAFDYVRKILEDHGEVKIWRVNMRPGKPLTFGRYQSVPVISLPGNPVSAFMGFLVFVVPVLRRLMGMEQLLQATIQAVLDTTIESDGRETYLRANVTKRDGKYHAKLSGHQGSGNLFALTRTNALLILPSGVQSLPKGADIRAWLLSEIED